MSNQDDALLDVRDTAGLLNVHPSKVYDLVKGGRLPVVYVGKSLRFSRLSLHDWIQRQTITPTLGRGDEATKCGG